MGLGIVEKIVDREGWEQRQLPEEFGDAIRQLKLAIGSQDPDLWTAESLERGRKLDSTIGLSTEEFRFNLRASEWPSGRGTYDLTIVHETESGPKPTVELTGSKLARRLFLQASDKADL